MTLPWSATAPSQQRSLWTAGLLLSLTFFLGFSVDWVTHVSAVPEGPGASRQGLKVDVLDLVLAAAALRLLWRVREEVLGAGAGSQPVRALWWTLLAVAVWRLLASVQVFLPLG